MSSHITHTIIRHTSFAYILDTCTFIFRSCELFTDYPNHIMYQSCRAWEGGPKEHKAKQKCPCETHSVTYVSGLSTLSDLLHIVMQSPLSLLCCPMPPSHRPSSLTSVSLVPTLHLLLPSTPFWQYGAHPFFPHAQTIAILSDLLILLYSLTTFYSTSPTHLYIITLSICDTPNKLFKHFISMTFTFLLLALLIPYASAP